MISANLRTSLKPCLLKPKNGQNNVFESTGLFIILFISDTCCVNITLDKAYTTLRYRENKQD